MKRIFRALAIGIACLAILAPPMIKPVLAAISTQDWYQRIEAMRKKGQDHPWVSAVVKGIDPNSGQMTISHGPIPHAKMPAMTMTFPVRDPSDLTAHQVGDHISFQVAEDGGVIRIVHIKSARGR